MCKIKIVSLLLGVLSVGVVSAQVRKTTAINKTVKKNVTVDEDAGIQFDRMLSSTAQIMVVDSFIAKKTDFIDKIPLEKDFGQISTLDRINGTAGQQFAYTYVNGFGNRMFFAKKGSDGHYKLFSADRLGNEWTNIKQIDDFGDEFEDINYPFMLADGTTLYFAAKGKGGLGGYDIYVTRYDISSEKFYKPENLGLPYNSKDNDYYCIIDDFNSLGWLVTDRRQNDDNVCVYVFVPQKERKVYDVASIGKVELNSLAELRSIRDTWDDKAERQAALDRLETLLSRSNNVRNNSICFIVNDKTVYTSVDDFKSSINRMRFLKLIDMRKSAENLSKNLDVLRQDYSQGSSIIKRKLSGTILKSEQQLEDLNIYIHTLEKEIRNAENLIVK